MDFQAKVSWEAQDCFPKQGCWKSQETRKQVEAAQLFSGPASVQPTYSQEWESDWQDSLTLLIRQGKVLTRNVFLIIEVIQKWIYFNNLSSTKSDLVVRNITSGRPPWTIPGLYELDVCTAVGLSPVQSAQEVSHCPRKPSILHSHHTLHTSSVFSHHL